MKNFSKTNLTIPTTKSKVENIISNKNTKDGKTENKNFNTKCPSIAITGSLLNRPRLKSQGSKIFKNI